MAEVLLTSTDFLTAFSILEYWIITFSLFLVVAAHLYVLFLPCTYLYCVLIQSVVLVLLVRNLRENCFPLMFSHQGCSIYLKYRTNALIQNEDEIEHGLFQREKWCSRVS